MQKFAKERIERDLRTELTKSLTSEIEQQLKAQITDKL